MKIIKLTEDTKKNVMEDLLKRSPNNYSQYEATVNDIIENVRTNKDAAIFEYTKKFDKYDLSAENIKVTRQEIEEAYSLMDAKLIDVPSTPSSYATAGLIPKKTVQFQV